jgi:glycosyltransferase involved in cell wall biosynthesis
MTADTIGGVWTYAMELARALRAHDVEIALATMGALPNESQRREARKFANVSLFESSYALEWMDDPWHEVERAGEWLLEIAAEFRPDVVHLNGIAHATLPWSAPVIVVAHSCVLSWWAAVRKEAAPSCYDEYRRRVSDGLAAADLIVAPTAAMLDSVVANYGPSTRGVVISNARDPNRFAPAAKEPVVFSCGRVWDEAKNIAGLNTIAPQLPWRVEVAGDFRHPSGRDVELSHVRCIGKISQEELAARMASASIFALPVRYEPFGLSAVEAALSGCALVLGEIPSQREVWDDAATFVQPDDHDQLAHVLNALIHNEGRRTDLAQRARARAKHFYPAAMANAYVSAYQSCVAREHAEVAA